MIKDFSVKKILKYSALLLIVFLFYLFPEKQVVQKNESTFNEQNIKYHDIFLMDKNGYISKTNISINSVKTIDLVEELVEAMVIDGKYSSKVPNGFTAIIPTDTKLNSKKIEEDTVVLDFNSNLLDVKSEYEEKIIESIVYTMTSINNIKNVKILIDNEPLTKFPKTGKYINETLDRNFGINKEYDISNLDDITKVTIYYVNKNNVNQIYYVPVTKYVNTNQEKIKIIIDELSSKISYESNLMSYLNYNAKLLDYSFDEDEVDLNFNEYLFDNKEQSKVLEEVIYSISYSVMDSYGVSKINFFVNNKQI